MLVRRFLITIIFILNSSISFCQESFRDTININLQSTDSLFLKCNISLLAEKCNVNAAQAQIIQARLFRNINISINQNIYNTEYKTNGGRQWFDFTNHGETNVEIQKLFLVAGKRNKQIKLAESGAEKAEQLYYDLIRTLKYSLHSQFYNIFYLSRILKVYDSEIGSLQKLLQAYEKSLNNGNISKKEYLRIKATLFSLENEKLGFINQMIDSQTELNLLLHTSNLYYSPSRVSEFSTGSSIKIKLQSLIDTAGIYRYDLRAARTDLKISDLNLSYQKALAIPDINLSGGWDRNGSYVHDYNYLGLQFDLPLFDRNQGNIKAAKFGLESTRYRLMGVEERISADVINAYTALVETERISSGFDNAFLTELEKMNEEMLRNFEKRNVSLIEFLDYYDAYKTNAVQLNTLMMNHANAKENLSFSVGKDVISN